MGTVNEKQNTALQAQLKDEFNLEGRTLEEAKGSNQNEEGKGAQPDQSQDQDGDDGEDGFFDSFTKSASESAMRGRGGRQQRDKII